MDDFFLYIQTFDALPHFPRPDCVGKETRNTRAYRFEGRWRRDHARVVFQYTLSGSGVFKDAAGVHPVSAGQGFLCEAHDPHMAYFYPPTGSTPWQFVFIDLYGAAAHTMAHDLIGRFGAIYTLPADHTFIRRLLSFNVYHHVGCSLSLSESSRLAMELFTTLAASKTGLSETHADHAMIRRFQEIVHSEIGKPLSVGQIAARLKVSAEHLARVFKQQTGMTPHVHIENAKMLAACSMLKSEPFAIKEIAWRLGYTTPANFVRTFRRVVRCSPLEFREDRVMPLAFGPLGSPKKPGPPSPLGKPSQTSRNRRHSPRNAIESSSVSG